MNIWEELRERMEGDLEYPPNYLFDPETLEPKRDLIQREKNLKAIVPEMFDGGNTFLDIGCNKGYWCVKLASKYKHVQGVDLSRSYIQYSQKLAEAHNITNALFEAGDFMDLALTTDSKFDVTYAGGVHHHSYTIQIEKHDWVFRPLNAWADATSKILVVDGPWNLLDPKHNTAAALAERDKWSADLRKFFSIEHHAAAIAGKFRLRAVGPSGTGTREIAVFERIGGNNG